MTRLGRVVGVLAGRTDQDVVDALLGQLQAVREGVELASRMVTGLARATARTRMEQLEHDGDDARARLVEVLSQSLATPIDREDLFRVSRSIDDVLDSLRDFVRESDLYHVTDQSRFVPILEVVGAGIDSLGTAVRALPGHPDALTKGALDAKKAGTAIGRLYQYGIADLFAGEMSAERMKTRELLRRLEIVGSHIATAADALADGAMKRWH